MKYQVKCIKCGTKISLEIDEEDYWKYHTGMKVQDAFPYLTDNEREILVSGFCSDCFDKIFEGGE